MLVAAAALFVAGCESPLGPRDSDYGRQTPPQRLREIQPLEIERFAKPAAPPDAPEADPAVAAKARFAGLTETPLSIAEVRAAALEHNLGIKSVLIDPTIAAQGVLIEESAFEPAFTTRALWQETDSPTASSLASAQQKFVSIEPGVRIPLRTGGTALVALPMSRTETDNAFSFLNPAYRSDLDFSISHPLLRNAGREVNTTGIRIASYNRQISEAQTKLAIINQLAAADQTYWRLYQARRNLDVAQQQYELAQAQLGLAERLVRAGKQAEIEVIRAQAGTAQRLDAIIVAQNTVLTQQRELKRILNLPGLEIDSQVAIIPSTQPQPVEYLVEAAPLTAEAVQNRMEMLELELRLLTDIANIRFAQNQTLPALDVNASYNIGGLGDSGHDSFRTLYRNRFESWTVGANLEVPLGNEGARARLRQSVLTRLQRLNTREARKLLIAQEVGDAVDRIQAGWQRILATRQSTILSARSFQAEQRQFDVGTSTSTDVLDAATRLALAQFEEIQSLVDYELAQIDLATATGYLLGESNIVWNPEPPPPREVLHEEPVLPGDPPPVTVPPVEK
jgi:outer membrane protein